MPSISVIIPAYNAEKYIGEAIQSVLNQTHLPKEIIVADDASVDRTVEIAQKFSAPVQVLVHSSNSGPGVMRNWGVRKSTGEYLAFLDSDDVWDPSHLENLSRMLDTHEDVGLVFCPVLKFGKETGQWPSNVDSYLEPRHAFLDMLRNISCVPSAMMVRRTLHNRIGGFDETDHQWQGRRIQAEDLDYVIRASLHTPVAAEKDPTTRYRVHDAQSSTIRVHQTILAFRYRLDILAGLAESPFHRDLLPMARDRVVRCWEEHIEEVWARRDLSGLRKMVVFGLKSPLLWRASYGYLFKSLLPAWPRNRL